MTDPAKPRSYIDDLADASNQLNRVRLYEPAPVRKRNRSRATTRVYCNATTKRKLPCGNSAGPNGYCHAHQQLYVPPPPVIVQALRKSILYHLPERWQPRANGLLAQSFEVLRVAMPWVGAVLAGLATIPLMAAACVLAYCAMLLLFGILGAGVEMLSMASD